MARTRFERDYYEVIGVRPESTEDEVRRAYRRLALQWHPDRNPGNPEAEERFKVISEAYAALIDPAKRREYDLSRSTGTTAGFHHSREDLFRDLFADPRASAIFEELARELARGGMRVNRHHFEQTLFGGRTVIRGGVFVITPFTPVLMAARLARAVLRGARAPVEPVSTAPTATLPEAPGFMRTLGRAVGRLFLGGAPAPARAAAAAGPDVVVPLRLSPDEAERGGRRRLVIDRGDSRDEVLVTIPAGVRPGTRLRLRGKGRSTGDGGTGDAYVAVEVDGPR